MAVTQGPGSLSAPEADNPLTARPAWRPAGHAELPGRLAVPAGAVLTAASARRWPGRERRPPLGYMNAEGLRQAAEGEELQFPRGTATVEADSLDDVQ
jgi:hypothetical protein